VVLGVAASQFYRAFREDLEKKLDLGKMGTEGTHKTVLLGRVGLAARGAVFAVIGFFLIVAALRHDPGEAKGLGGALAEFAQRPFGQALLLVVAAGLTCYGFYALTEARYRRVGSA
jgi:hypothetical protein